MRDGVQARRPLVVGADDVPGRDAGVGLLQHHVARAGVVVPALRARHVHRTQLPLPDRILDAGLEPSLLLVVADLQPQLDQDDAALDHELLDLRDRSPGTACAPSSEQKPITRSTPARLYQLRSKITTSPAAGKCCM